MNDPYTGRSSDKREALAYAREVRSAHRRLRDALAARELDPFDVIEGRTPPELEALVSKIRIERLLPMIPGIGKPSTFDLIVGMNVSPTMRLGQLPPERRRELSLLVRGARNDPARR